MARSPIPRIAARLRSWSPYPDSAHACVSGDRNVQGGMSDALAAMTGARHLSMDGSIASVLIAYQLENAIAGVLARNLYQLSPAQLSELAISLDGLPSGSSLGNAFESGKKCVETTCCPLLKGQRPATNLSCAF